ncbi:MAG: prepilin-type N-terminal cleavage/methylation domain-containing protein [Chloroflexi bacterium]|nr:prepilin-type N-terminal cleavage/methylation domain-containing protein [Chloroflexota bacterium]
MRIRKLIGVGELLRRREKGLTAIELAVVMAVLAILAGIVAGSVTGMNQSARSAAATTDAKEVQKAVDRWVGEHNSARYPVSTPVVVDAENAVASGATPASNGLPRAGAGLYVRIAFTDSFTSPEGVTRSFVPNYLARIPKYGRDDPNPWVVDEKGTAKILAAAQPSATTTATSIAPATPTPTSTATPTTTPTPTPTRTPTASGTWVTKAPMPTARRSMVVGVINGTVYVASGQDANGGGLTVVEAYDPVANTWASTSAMPVANISSVSGVIDGILYVAGVDSSGPKDTVYAYDPAAGPGGTWTTKSPMPEPRGAAAGGVIGGKLYVAGGWNSSNQSTATLYAYDPAAGPGGTWTTLAPMPAVRMIAAAGVIDGKLYVVGGSSAWLSGYIGDVYAYDPVGNAWTALAAMPTPRVGMAAAVVGGVLYAIGGGANGIDLATVEAYDPATNTWSARTAMPTARNWLAAASVGGTIYALGGVNVVDRVENEAFTP